MTVSDPSNIAAIISRQITSFGTGVPRFMESTPDGSLYVSSFKQKATLAGRMCVVTCGSVTTPLTFLTTAANRPDWVIRVLAGTAILPVSVETILEAAAGTATEIDIRAAANDIGNGTSSAATVGPLSTLINGTAPVFTPATIARQLYTGDATAETAPVSLHRRTFPLAQASGLIPYDDYWNPNGEECIIVGPGTLEGFVAATTTQATGYVIIKYIELSTDWPLGR